MSASKVLVVEDHPDMANVTKMLLETLGYEPSVATSIEGAVEAISEKPFDVLLVDYRLPDGTGNQLLARLPAGVDIPAVLVTAFDEHTLPSTMREGFRGVLRKPVDAAELQSVVDRLCERKDDSP